MKHLKMFGLAAVAAMALMALVGTGTASAAGGVLCKGIAEPCKESEQWLFAAHMTFPLKAGTQTRLTTTGGSALQECGESEITGKVLSAGSKTVNANVEVKKEWLTWGKCAKPMATATGGVLEFEYRKEPETKGTVFAKNFVFTAEVGGVHCYYKSGTTPIDIGKYSPGAEGKDGILAVSVTTTKENSVAHPSSAFCFENVVWEGEYTLSGNTPLYIKGE